MIIEAICDYEAQDFDLQPLTINRYPMFDTFNFELDDLTIRPQLCVFTNPLRYSISLYFSDYEICIQSPYKELARHVLALILLDIDVREHEVRALFPELLI